MKRVKLYVGNLSRSVDEADVKELFSAYGEVCSIKLVKGSGFGFVEMSNQENAEKAINELDGSSFKGLTLGVNKPLPYNKKKKKRRSR